MDAVRPSLTRHQDASPGILGFFQFCQSLGPLWMLAGDRSRAAYCLAAAGLVRSKIRVLPKDTTGTLRRGIGVGVKGVAGSDAIVAQ